MSVTTTAIHYALSRWDALVRYSDDGRIEIDNNAAERALRPVALGRKNYLFAGSDTGGERVAAKDHRHHGATGRLWGSAEMLAAKFAFAGRF
jgi:hypothetical protein